MVLNHNIHTPTVHPCASMATSIFFLLIIITITITPWPAASLSFNYIGFDQSSVKLEGNASTGNANSSVQLTVNPQGQQTDFSVGRVINREQLYLWDKDSRQLTDFTTEFSFDVYSSNGAVGDGMAFFLAHPNFPFSETLAPGAGFGVAALPDDYQILNSSGYQIVAVEFDTYKNEGIDSNDTTSTHVGIDINSIISRKTETWLPDIADQSKNYGARIDYNSSTHNLTVSFITYRTETPENQSLSYQVDLSDYLPQSVVVGFSASTGYDFEMYTLKSWSFSSTLRIEENGNGSKTGLWVGLGTGLGFLVCFMGLVWFLVRKKKAGPDEDEFVFDVTMDDDFEKGTGPKKFLYNELVSATNNFAEAEKLGQGGFGGVYRGFLKELNSYVAIKRISKGSKQGTKEYATEVKIISQLRHRNLVQLIGWCHQKSNLLLIYEFMPNRSLDFHLFDENCFLTWKVRYDIAKGLASAMLYLQEEWEQCVLHRDIKSSNVMLDSNFNAKLGDFGLARLVDHGKGSQTTVIAGTMGYMATECLITGKASKESDIFSFGIVALEIACGRKPINPRAIEREVRMVEWVWELYGVGKLLEAADPKLNGEYDIQQMERLMVVGLWCAHPDPMLRPSIRQAIHVLNFESPLPILPEKMPVPTYLPPPSSALMSSISFSTGGSSFDVESKGTQQVYYSSQQYSSSSAASSASAALLRTV